jgi:tryptophan synthase alpha subunit
MLKLGADGVVVGSKIVELIRDDNKDKLAAIVSELSAASKQTFDSEIFEIVRR